MKYNTKLYSVAFATAVVISFLILVPSEAFADPLTITETQITTSGNSTNADIYGNTIVYDKYTIPNPDDPWNRISDIYIYDITTKKETRITNSGSASNPHIYGSRIVYEKFKILDPNDPWNRTYDIYMYDVSAKKETRITTNGNSFSPDIYNNKIVYQDSGICLYDLTTKTVTKIVEDMFDPTGFGDSETDNTNPTIYDNRLAWLISDYPGGGDVSTSYIGIYDLNTKKISNMGGISSGDRAGSPDMYNNRIVWAESTEVNGDNICVYDFSTKKETYIATTFDSWDLLTPAIFNNRIVWGNFIYDLSTKNETNITSSGSASNPAIYGDRIVWQDSRNGKSDIYMATLSTSNPLVAAFSASPLSGRAPLKVQFTDKSTGSPTSWSWKFGDGSTSTTKSPVHTYSKAGKYTVSLTVKNAAGNNTVTKSSFITVISSPVAAFSASPTSGKPPLTVSFTDKSTGIPSSQYWNFGDGSTSNVQNPVHKYAKIGKYTVTLKVTNAAGSNTVIKRSYITVLNPPVAAFSASPTSGKAPLTVKFTDKSTGSPSSWYWNFGDGSTSNAQSPVHKYTKVGKYTYTVTLKVTNVAGSSTAKRTITTS